MSWCMECDDEHHTYTYDTMIKLRRKYKLTLDDWWSMYAAQEYHCACCERKYNTDGTALCVDHNHTTGKIRGLLCDQCNTAIGMVQDNTNILKNMINYLGEK